MINGSVILDRAVIGTLISKLSQEQQGLVKSLTKTSSPAISSSSNYEAWLKLRGEIETYDSKLKELLGKVKKNEPGSCKDETDAAQIALIEAKETHRILSILSNVCKSLNSFKDDLGADLSTSTAKTLLDVKLVLKELGKEERCGLKVISVLKARRAELQSSLANKIERDWKELINVSEEGILIQSQNFPPHLKDLIDCSKYLQTFPALTQNLSERIFNLIILPIINGNASCANCQEKHVLQISKDSSSSGNSSASRLAELHTVFIFLQENIFILDTETNLDMAAALGGATNGKFVEAIRSVCIGKSLPMDFDEFEAVKVDIMENVVQLKELLFFLEWISPTGLKEWDCDTDVLEELYAAKLGEDLLIRSRQLFISENDFLEAKRISSNKDEVDDGFDRLKEMSVSLSIFTIAKQCRSILQKTLPYKSMKSLMSSVYNAFSMLLDVVPYCFQDRLISIPSAGAMYFTSCIYASHQLGIYNQILQSSKHLLKEDKEIYSNWTLAFSDLMFKLRSKAYSTIDAMSALFSKEVLDSINNSQTAWLTKIAQNQLQSLLDKVILQRGLDMLKRLSSTWREILPPDVFQQAVGAIIDAVLLDSASRVIAVEDINASQSNTLCENFRWLLSQSTDLLRVGEMSKESAPFKHVPSWLRFNEIIFVLDASMTQIAERWADNNGPLAEHLLPEELKKMIRALFENNDKRARLLAVIK